VPAIASNHLFVVNEIKKERGAVATQALGVNAFLWSRLSYI